MANKKEKKVKKIQAKKSKQKRRMGILGIIVAISVGFLIFFFVTLFDSLYPPTTGQTPRTQTQEKEQMTLFFADPNERFLVPETRYMTRETNQGDQAAALVAALIEGSRQGGMKTIPSGAELIDVKIMEEGMAVVNFKENIIDLHPGGSASEIMTIFSISNTILTNIPSLNRVLIKVEGKSIQTLKGHMNTESPIGMNEELIIEERS
ncbi:MAG: GerMN domain-containing protein [Syntrophales bacterium]|nr:GerMN domain-containing protein [Syntrophales bacterium]